MAKARTPAVAYLRTSSAANVGADKDSDKRQRAAIEAVAKRAGYELVDEFYDAAIAADNPGSFIDATPTAKLVRQVLGAISEFDKAMTVAPLS